MTMTRLASLGDKRSTNDKIARTNALICNVQPTLEGQYDYSVIREVFRAINAGKLTTAQQVFSFAASLVQ